MDLGKAIKTCRAQKGWTQSELSKRTGIAISHLSMMEKNLRDPSLTAVQAISNAFGLPLNVLIFLAADSNEISGMSEELKEKMSRAALELLKLPSSGHLFSKPPDRKT